MLLGILLAGGPSVRAAAVGASGPPTQVDVEWIGETVLSGVEALGAVDPEALLLQWQEFAPADLDALWESLETALASGNMDELAGLDSYAHQALDWMDSVPEMESLADWFRQRLDYLDVAAALEPVPVSVPAPPPRKVAPVSKKSPAPVPAKVKSPAPTPVAAKARAKRSVGPKERSVGFWKKRIGNRVVPAPRTAVIPRLKEIFREEGVPEDLVWMAETESTLNPAARSPAGAVGLFQFMPATAGRFGLQVAPRDERLEPEKSARAAARYLHFLNGRFGDWPLALAAYNAGEGRVGSALKRSRGKTFEAAAPHLPPETQLYVPKVLATIAVREGRAFEDG